MLKSGKDNHMCFGCSVKNPIGLQLHFTMIEDVCQCNFIAQEEHQGWNGYMHGGLIATLIDETMGQWLWMHDIAAMTAEITVRYSHPVPIKVPLTIEASKVEEKRNVYLLEGKILLPQAKVAVRATSKFMAVSMDL